MENLILVNFEPTQIILTVLMCVFVLIGIIAFRINDRIQMRVALLMDNECKIYNRNGLAKYIKRKGKKFKNPSLLNVKIVNLGYLYTNYKDKHQMMMQITDTMLKGLSQIETLGRVEFNEFMILVEDLKKEELRERCKDIGFRLSECYFENYGLYNFKIEFGVYENPDLHDYQGSIDKCLAIIKYSEIRQNNVWYFSQDVADKIQKLNNVNELKTQALESKQFAAYVQPKVDYKTGNVCGGEMLVRWVDEDHKVIFYPDDFIPLFEQNGFIKKLDFVMFEQTCAFAQTLKQKGFKDIVLSVNISKINFDSPTFIEDISTIIAKYPGISPRDIEIEITESANMEGSQHLSSIIMSLRQLGYKLAMDDFGKDYSTLGSLVNCPYDTIKMDMFFFRNRLSTEKEKDIATNVLNLLSKLNVEIVCEGIEDENTINILGTVTHEFVIQGYYISKPIPISQFEPFLQTHYDFVYPEISGVKSANGKEAEKPKKKESNAEQVTQTSSLQNEEINELKKQLEMMKSLIEEKNNEGNSNRDKELEALKEEIKNLKNGQSQNYEDRDIQRLKDELALLKGSNNRSEYYELQRQIDELKYRNNARHEDSTNDRIELMIERLKAANQEQFDKLNEENRKYNENLQAQLKQAQSEREKFMQLLSEYQAQEQENLTGLDKEHEQEEANKLLDLNIDDLEFEDEDDELETSIEKDYKPTLSEAEIYDIISKYQDKYGADWIDKAQEEMGEEAFHNLTKDMQYYNDNEKRDFRVRMLAAGKDQKKIYNIVKNEFMKYENVSYKITKKYDTIYVGRSLVAQIGTRRTRIKVFLALDPNEYSQRTYPHKDVSQLKAHAKTSFMVLVDSNIQVKRLIKLVGEVMSKNNASLKEDYKPFDYINSLKYEES